MTDIKKLIAVAAALCCMSAFAACGDSAADTADTGAADNAPAAAAEDSPAETEEAKETPADEAAEDKTEDGTEAAEDGAEEAAEETETAEPAEFDITKVAGYDEAAEESVLEIVDGSTSPWASAFGSFTTVEGTQSDDFIDSRTFERDKDMHVVVDFQYTPTTLAMIEEGATDLHKTQVVIGPCHANGWHKFGENVGDIIVDYPEYNVVGKDGDGTWKAEGENVVSVDNSDVWAPVFVKSDGFIKVTDPEITQIEFTLPAKVVNELIDKWEDADEESNFDGILFQLGGSMQVTKITIDQGNVFRASTLAEAGF